MPFNIHSLYRQVFKIWREKRFRLFLKTLQPKSTDTLLDVGGRPAFWTNHPQPVARIDSLNIQDVPFHPADAPSHRIRTLVGDGCALGMPDRTYDVGFSNSVIEHVGTWERQQQFAREIRRVARSLWIQTPARICPIEPHYMTPFIHYLPRAWQKKLLRRCTLWGWIARPSPEYIDFMVTTTRLLRKSEMQQLFPDCRILTERLLWIIPKSYIAYRHPADRGVTMECGGADSALAFRGRAGDTPACQHQRAAILNDTVTI